VILPDAGPGTRRILAAGFLAAALSAPGQTFFVTLYVPEIADALALGPVTISTLYGVATLLGAALLPLLGAWADRWPASRFLGAVVAGIGLSMVLLASATGPVSLMLAWIALRCLGQGAVGVGMLTALSRAFVAYRGRALAIGTLGHPFGEMVFPISIAVLLAMAGWRQSLLVFAALYLLLGAPLVAVWLRGVPRHIGVRPGDDPPSATGSAGARGLGDAARTRVFWLATLALTAAPVVVTALLFHQVVFFEGTGLSRHDVPLALIYFAAAEVVATILTGRMVDDGDLRAPLALSSAALAIATFSLGLPVAPDVRIALYGLTLGYATGAAGVAGAALWPVYFGVAIVGRIRALTGGIRNAATAGAPLLVAVVAERADLDSARLVLALCGAIALVLALALPRPPHPSARADR
jgi:sugar phosphate permease